MGTLTEDVYKYLLNKPLFNGYEGTISKYRGDLIKLFEVIPQIKFSNSTPDFYENKKTKIEKIMDIPSFQQKNIIYPKDIYTVYNQFCGYTMPNTTDLKPLCEIKRNPTEKIEILKRFRRLLDYFHDQNIVYGDIKQDNMLISDDSSKIGFCDLDNMIIDKIPIDLMTKAANYFIYYYKFFDYKLDSFIFNLFTVYYLYNFYPEKNYEGVIDYLQEKGAPLFTGKTDYKKIKEITEQMNNIDHNYNGEYYIDYIK